MKTQKQRTISQTPAPKKERIYGSAKNVEGSSTSLRKAKSIDFSEGTLSSIKSIVEKHNKKYPSKKITLPFAKAVVRRGMGAYSSSHRPTISGGKPNSRVAWGLARLNASIYKIVHGKSKSGKYVQDDDLIKEVMKHNKKYEVGGMVQHLSSPIITTGMQNSLSVWGGSPINVFKGGGKIATLKTADEVSAYVKKVLGSRSYELPLECVIYVPSTRGVEIRIGSSEFNDRIEEVKRYLTKLFGGNSTVKVEGGYKSEDLKKIIEEDTAKVTAYARVEDLQEHFYKLLKRVTMWGKKWGQEGMGFEFEGDFFSVNTKDEKEEEKMRQGGKVGFEGLAKKVAKRYEGMKVEKKYQKEYGKTYDKDEALEVGRKVSAKVYRQQLAKKMSDGGGVGDEGGLLPPTGELKNKDNFLLKYEKKGDRYEFYIYRPTKTSVKSYEQIKYVCVNKDCPTKMNYNQFVDYLYAETYLDDKKYANGGGVESFAEGGLMEHGLRQNDIIRETDKIGKTDFIVENPNEGFFRVDIMKGTRVPVVFDTESREYITKAKDGTKTDYFDNSKSYELTMEEVDSMTDDEVIELANTISFYDREDEGIGEFDNFEDAKKYLRLIIQE